MITRRSARLACKSTDSVELAVSSKEATRAPPAKNEPPKTTRLQKRAPKKKTEPPTKKKKVTRTVTDKSDSPNKRLEQVRVPTKFEPISDPIVDDLRKQPCDTTRDLESEILDQISLEGLIGINYRRLLVFLDALYPNLKPLESENVQDYIFKVIVKRYLALETAIVKAYFYDKSKLVSDGASHNEPNVSDKPIKLPKKTADRLKITGNLVLHPVQDGKIRGSCENYRTRVDITQKLLDMFEQMDTRECIETINARYGLEHVFFVASQKMRFGALVANWVDPQMDINLREYCTLELIGQSRSLGIVFPNDKQFGRYRILLTAKGLISQYQENCSTFVIHHLVRFSPKKSKFKRVVEKSTDRTLRNICCYPNRLRMDRDFMKMIYDFIALSENGCTQLDIRKKFRLPKFHIRNHLKNMIALAWIYSKTDKSGDRPLRVYRTVHKSFRRWMLMKERLVKPERGVMASWDEKDLHAKKILGQKRSSFTRAEDSYLILCRIASLVLEPNLRKVSFCVNKKVIRDLMHRDLVESRDKTSDACLRRMKYLRRLPSIMVSIDESTAELRVDNDIMKLVADEKPKPSHDEDRLNRLFGQLLKTIRFKIPYLLGMQSTSCASRDLGRNISNISNYEELKRGYDVVECHAKQSTMPIGKLPSSSRTSSSLMQLARPINSNEPIELSESNEISSIAMLTSLCAYSSFEFDLQLKIPINVVDRSNENYKELCARANLSDALIVQPCSVRIRSKEREEGAQDRSLAAIPEAAARMDVEQRAQGRKQLSAGSAPARSSRSSGRRGPRNQAEPAIECEQASASAPASASASESAAASAAARPWKTLDGRVDIETQSKLIEALLSWIIMFPGIEFSLIQKEFGHLMPAEHLLELLDLMKDLELISVDKFEHGTSTPADAAADAYATSKPCLFGKARRRPCSATAVQQAGHGATYEPRAGAFIKYCQLLERYINQIDDQIDGSHM